MNYKEIGTSLVCVEYEDGDAYSLDNAHSKWLHVVLFSLR